MTLDDLYERWVRVKRGIKTVTFNKYKHDYKKYIQPSLGRKRLDSIKSTDIRAFYNELTDDLAFAVSTIGTIHRLLHQILDLGVDDDLLRKNPSTKALKDFKSEHSPGIRKNKAMTFQEQQLFEKFLETSKQYRRWQPLFTTMLWTGLRAGELSALRWCDVDFNREVIVVDHALSYHGDEELKNNRNHIDTPKSVHSVREIHMLPQVKEALLKEKRMQEIVGLKCNVEIDGFTDFVFLTRNGGPKHVWGMNDALDNIVRDCNTQVMREWEETDHEEEENPVTLPPLSCHWLRHSFATRCCEAEVNPKALQRILGHADFETTMDIYAEATDDLKKSQLIYLNEYFKNVENDEKSGLVVRCS